MNLEDYYTKNVKSLLKQFHRYEIYLSDEEIDDLLKLSNFDSYNHNELESKFGQEQFFYEGTPYYYIRHILHNLNLNENDIIYDLGSGYGRLCIYGGVTTSAKYRGIEIVPERVKRARLSMRLLGIYNIQFVEGNVLAQEFADGNIFFLFNPFILGTLSAVGERLKKIAKIKSIKIITWGGPSNDFFQQQKWLAEDPKAAFERVQFFTSNHV